MGRDQIVHGYKKLAERVKNGTPPGRKSMDEDDSCCSFPNASISCHAKEGQMNCEVSFDSSWNENTRLMMYILMIVAYMFLLDMVSRRG